MDLIPVVKSNEACFYDDVSGKLFRNKGTGFLMPGPRISNVGENLWTWPNGTANETHNAETEWFPDVTKWYVGLWTGRVAAAIASYIDNHGDGFVVMRTFETGFGASRFMMLKPGTYQLSFTASGADNVSVYLNKYVRSNGQWKSSTHVQVDRNAFTIDETSLYMFEFWNRDTTLTYCDLRDIQLKEIAQ